MPSPFVSSVAESVPFLSEPSRNTALGDSLQDFVDRVSAPTTSQKPEYLPSGEVDRVTFYRNASQTVANRIALVQVSYDGLLNPTSEAWTLYAPDGTTVLKTVTLTHTFAAADLTNTTMVTI